MTAGLGDRPRLLVIEHETDAGPALFGPWLEEAGVRLDILRPYEGAPVPGRCDHDGLLVLGGSMGALDDAEAPWLAGVRSLMESAAEDSTPMLGICLGAQLLAVATGGRVERGGAGLEIGVCDIELTPEAVADPLFGPMPSPLEAAEWHQDAVTALPPGARMLARGQRYEVQAYRVGDTAWGVQFHPEADAGVMRLWAQAPPPDGTDRAVIEEAVNEVHEGEERLRRTWKGFAERFAAVLQTRVPT